MVRQIQGKVSWDNQTGYPYCGYDLRMELVFIVRTLGSGSLLVSTWYIVMQLTCNYCTEYQPTFCVWSHSTTVVSNLSRGMSWHDHTLKCLYSVTPFWRIMPCPMGPNVRATLCNSLYVCSVSLCSIFMTHWISPEPSSGVSLCVLVVVRKRPKSAP